MNGIGDRFDLLGEHLSDPYPFFAQARAEQPVFYSPRMRAWVVTRYQDVLGVLLDNHTYSSVNAIRTIADPPLKVLREFAVLGYPPVKTTINSDGRAHRRLRSAKSRAFSSDRVKAVEGFVRARGEHYLDALAVHGTADLMEQLARPLPVAVITHLYGVEEIDEQMVRDGTRGNLVLQGNLAASRLALAEQVAAVRDFVRLCRAVREAVYRRRAAPRDDDLVSMCVTALLPPDRSMNLEQEAQVVLTLSGELLAGHETTAAQLGNGLRQLLTHRDQWELLCARPELAGRAVEESCRFDTSVPGMFRTANRPVTIAGQDIPSGSEIYLALSSANRDETLSGTPDVFDISRDPVRHLGFGQGQHYCPGAEAGRQQLRIVLELLARRLPDLRLADSPPVEIEPMFVIRGPRLLPVVW